MGGIQTNVIFNANVYQNGVNLIGRAEEVQTPIIKYKKVEQKNLGMVGTSKLIAGIEAMDAKIKFNSFYVDVFEAAANPYQEVNLQIRANIEKYLNSTKVSEEPAVLFLGGSYAEIPTLGNLKSQEKVEWEAAFDANYAKLVVNGKELYEIDVINNIWKVSGKDILQQYRINIGA